MPEKWTKEKILEDAKKYTSIREWQKNSKGASHAAYRHKFYIEATAHMPRKYRSWTNEEVIADAKLYSSKTEWHKNSMGYTIALRRKIIDISCKHMKPIGSRYKRQIYAIENVDRSVYVGLSYNPERRYKQHIKYGYNQPCSKILYQHYTDGNQKLRIFETFYSLAEVQIKEAECIEKYRNDGWTILNTAKAGSLGTPVTKYTREYCAELAKGFVDKKGFRLKHELVYHSMHKNGWLDLISHLPRRKLRRLYTDEEIQAAASQCKTRLEFYKRFPKYYRSAINHGIFEKITKHLPSKHKKKRISKKR